MCSLPVDDNQNMERIIKKIRQVRLKKKKNRKRNTFIMDQCDFYYVHFKTFLFDHILDAVEKELQNNESKYEEIKKKWRRFRRN